MQLVIGAIAAVLAIGVAILLLILRKSQLKLRHFNEISDVEAYRDSCRKEAEQSISLRDASIAECDQQKQGLSELKEQVRGYQEVVKDFKSAVELRKYVAKMSQFASGCKTLGELQAKIVHSTQLADQLADDAQKMGYEVRVAKEAGDIQQQIEDKQAELTGLRAEILAVEEVKEMQEFGFYRRKYDLGSSQAYRNRLDRVRDEQKQRIKTGNAAACDTTWTVSGSEAQGRKMVNDKMKLLLRAFNGESDAAIAQLSHSNATAMEKRIQNSFKQINRMGEVNQVYIKEDYLKLKIEELSLTHEHRIQVQEEKESQQRIKQQMKEEAKVEKEVAKATADAERDEEITRKALEEARKELESKQGRQTENLAAALAKCEMLSQRLQEAVERKAKAIARAQLTKSGHVYVLSNIGSFGNDVFKIGMTRRLEPLERVKELGSASVPFYFDVHAMIYSENAPALEAELHRRFDHRRINVVNCRKEFFRVGLDEIEDAVNDLFGTITFMKEPEAAEYRQTVARLAEETVDPTPVGWRRVGTAVSA